MTGEEFIKVLKRNGYSYEMEGDKIIVTYKDSVYLSDLTSLPPDVEFKNEGGVNLSSLTSISPGVEFKNKGSVNLRSLTSLPPGVVFKNGGNVYLESLTSIPPGVEFKNKKDVYLRSLIGGWIDDWKGNIEGIDSNRLLNSMIKQGIFER
jgi:hypothetical protein